MRVLRRDILHKLSKSLPWARTIAQRSWSRSCALDSPAEKVEIPSFLDFHDGFDPELKRRVIQTMTVHTDFVTAAEEESIFAEIQPYLKRLRYEYDHWDDAIHGYRETERLKWNEENTKIIDRLRNLAFPPGSPQLAHVHVLDLDAKGVIKPHIDSVRFCGNTIAGVSLLSNSVMRLVHDKRKDQVVDIFLQQRSLYIMRDDVRFDYTHEILGHEQSTFKGEQVQRARRISVICRNEPSTDSSS